MESGESAKLAKVRIPTASVLIKETTINGSAYVFLPSVEGSKYASPCLSPL